jgi:hypothetical protein
MSDKVGGKSDSVLLMGLAEALFPPTRKCLDAKTISPVRTARPKEVVPMGTSPFAV